MVRARQPRAPKKQTSFDINECIARVIAHTLRPDYTSLIDEINQHEFVTMRFGLGTFDPETGREYSATSWGKVLYTFEGCCIVESLERKWNSTRFETYKIQYDGEWETKFVEYIDPGHPRYQDASQCWVEGMFMYMEED